MKRGIALVLVLIVLLTPLGVYAASMPSYAVSYDHTLSTGLHRCSPISADTGEPCRRHLFRSRGQFLYIHV